MATLILGIVGGVAGGLIAGPGGALKGAMLGWSIGTTVGGIIDQSKEHYYTADMGRTSDLRVTTSSYGTSIPQCWGKTRIPAIIIWATDLIEHEQDVNSGGGSGGPKVTTRNYTYTASFALLLCKGNRVSTNSVVKIYADDLVIYDRSVPASQNMVNPRFYTGSETQNADPLIISSAGNTDIAPGTDNPAFRGSCYMVIQDMVLTKFGNRPPNFSIEMDTGTVYVSDVITDICLQLGLTASQIDVTQVSAIPVTGMTVASRIDGKSALQPILDAYSVDLADINGKITAVPRGGAPVATLTFDDMGAQIVSSGNVPVTQRIVKTREPDTNLPSRVDVGYFSPTVDMQQAAQGAVKQSALILNNVSLQYPLTLNDAEAKAIASKQLFLPYIERLSAVISLMPKWEILSVTDVLLVQTDVYGTLQRMRLTEAETGMMGEIKTTFTRDDNGVLTQQTNSGTPTGGFVTRSPVITDFLAWSGTELRNEDGATPGIYVAATGGAGWGGCSILISTDGGSTYPSVGSCASRSVFGTVTNALSSNYSPNSTGFDATNALSVAVNGALTSTNENDVKNGQGNYGLLLSNNTNSDNRTDYEIFGFANVSLVSANSYTISDLLRAQRSTVATGHNNTDYFVQLSSAVVRIPVSTNLVGQTVLVKCVSSGIDPLTVTAQSVYIAAPTAPYASDASVTAAIASAAPKVPFYRTRYKTGLSTFAQNAALPGGEDFTSGYVAGSWYAVGPDGSVRFSDPGLEIALQFKIGIKNTSNADIVINFNIPAVDNGAKGIFNGSVIFAIQDGSGTSVQNGTFTIPANTSGILELYYYNKSTGSSSYNTSNQATFSFFTDMLNDPELTWYDVGV